jgi:hypothetical protein
MVLYGDNLRESPPSFAVSGCVTLRLRWRTPVNLEGLLRGGLSSPKPRGNLESWVWSQPLPLEWLVIRNGYHTLPPLHLLPHNMTCRLPPHRHDNIYGYAVSINSSSAGHGRTSYRGPYRAESSYRALWSRSGSDPAREDGGPQRGRTGIRTGTGGKEGSGGSEQLGFRTGESRH